MKKAIAYFRVSTEHQGKSGLGLDAQRKIVLDFVLSHDMILLQEFTEVESGRNNKRTVLKEALTACEKHSAVLVIAKLDRLSRNVAFLSALMETKAEFLAVDMPFANKFFIHIMAAVAQYQAEEGSRRTKAALQVAKERGTELGKHGKYVLSKKNKDKADEFALKMQPVIKRLNEKGITTIRQLSKQLNRGKIAPYCGKEYKWHPRSVFNVVSRIKKLQETQSSVL